MNRRAMGRGRLLIGSGAVIALVGSLPAWWTVGGTVAPASSGNAFDGTAAIVVFVCAVAALALLVLPLASRSGESALDRPVSYFILALAGGTAFVLRMYELAVSAEWGGLGLPDRAPGLWLTGAGLLLFVWGVGELIAERPT